jgi:hypothetical protein
MSTRVASAGILSESDTRSIEFADHSGSHTISDERTQLVSVSIALSSTHLTDTSAVVLSLPITFPYTHSWSHSESHHLANHGTTDLDPDSVSNITHSTTYSDAVRSTDTGTVS